MTDDEIAQIKHALNLRNTVDNTSKMTEKERLLVSIVDVLNDMALTFNVEKISKLLVEGKELRFYFAGSSRTSNELSEIQLNVIKAYNEKVLGIMYPNNPVFIAMTSVENNLTTLLDDYKKAGLLWHYDSGLRRHENSTEIFQTQPASIHFTVVKNA